MGLLFSCAACRAHEQGNLRLIAELADQKEFILNLLKQNKDLVDKVLAVTSPVALREYRREPSEPPKINGNPPRPRFPGLNPPRRPPGAHVLDAPGRAEAENALDTAIRDLRG